MSLSSLKCLTILTILAIEVDDTLTYFWPLLSEFTSGNQTLTIYPALSLVVSGNGGGSTIVKDAFQRYRKIIFNHTKDLSVFGRIRYKSDYDISNLKIVVQSVSEELQLGVDESYTLFVDKSDGQSILAEATIEANTVYDALHGLENQELEVFGPIQMFTTYFHLDFNSAILIA